MSSNKPTVAITGASGFLGTQLVSHFLNKKWHVVALVRNPDTAKRKDNLEYRQYDISKKLPENILKGCDYIIHAAYIKLDAKNPEALELNVTGAEHLLAAAKDAKVSQLVFVSTMSAHEEAISVYGKQKLTIEGLFLRSKNNTVIRSGLIIGNGGIVREMATFMKTKHAVPLIGGGLQPLQVISVSDLVQSIDNIVSHSITGRFVVANPTVYSYREFYQALAERLSVKVLYVPLPYWALEGLFKTATLLRISLGVGDDNLKGLKKLKSMPSEKDMKRIGVKPLELKEALKGADIG